MDASVTLTSAFLLGLFSTVHCIGMCGGIIGALSLSLPQSIRDNKTRLVLFVSMYNVGRIISYSFAGFVVAYIGAEAAAYTDMSDGPSILHYLGVSMMIAIGLYLGGWLPQLSVVEKIGVPLWRKLDPIGRKMMPVDSLPKALAYGLIWGWLPCGLVYFVLIWALTAGDAVRGAMLMASFGLGTLPTLLAAGFMTSWLTRFTRNPVARQVVGLLVIAMAIASLFIQLGFGDSGHHHH